MKSGVVWVLSPIMEGTDRSIQPIYIYMYAPVSQSASPTSVERPTPRREARAEGPNFIPKAADQNIAVQAPEKGRGKPT